MATWHNIESARSGWVGAPLDDDIVQELLDIAQEEIIAYAPTLDTTAGLTVEDGYVVADPDGIPPGWRWAQLQHARNIWNAAKVNPSGGFGADGEQSFAITPFPLDWSIKQRIRPRKAIGVVG